jgi:cytoskeletal protein CcmA (bactofilin family)
MPKNTRSGGLSKGNLFDTNIKATSIDEDIFSDQTLLDAAAADGDLILLLDVSEDPDKIKYITRTNLLGSGTVNITNNTNNYVLTATGSAVNGEANLQFDGTTLAVESGAVNIDISSGDPHLSFQISDTDKFTLGVDDSDSDKFKIDTGGTVGGATKFTLDSSGNVTIAGDLTVSGSSTAAIATTVTITDNESTNEDNAIIFTSGGDVDGGNIGLESDGDLYYNPSTGRLTATQLAGTLQTAAQTNVTSLGTLTALTVDNVAINGATIGHTGDTDLLTLASGVLTVAGEVDATTLDVSGNADIDGTLEADAITVDGTALDEFIADTIGAMVTSNTESGITVAYQDGDNTLDFTVGTLNQDTTGTAATVTGAAQSAITSLGTLTTLTVDNVIINGTTIGHTSDTDLITVADGLVTVAGEVSMTTLDIGGTNVTTTAAEINLIDGGTSRGTTAVASGDGILINDGGTMRMTNVDTVSTYFASHSVGGGNIVTTGALNSGSITSGFGTIDNGSSAITTTGTVTFGSLSDGSVTVTAWVDEDDMSSDSATLVPTQQSVKAYVDSEGGSMSNFYLEDDDGTEVTVSNGKEVKIIGSGVTTNWTDTSHGSDSDPYDLTITVDAAQTGITSIYATDLIMGEDAQTAIDFGTANEIDFKVDNAARLTLTSGALYPVTNNQIDLGTSSLEFKDAFFDGTVTADAFAGPLTGDVTGNVSGTAATVTTAAQGNITSLGTLTALTVDDVAINGKVVTMTGSTDDTAVFTVGTHGTLTIETTDTAAAAANLQITADGTVDIDSAGVLTLDSGAAINIEPASGSAILLDGTISIDGGAITGVASILQADVKIGEDDQTKIDFETADEIHFYAANVEQVYLADNIFGPQSDSDVDLGTTGVRWKDAFVDSITVTGEVDAVTLDISGNADIDGTTNLDAVDIDGNVQLDGTFTVGVDDTGQDVKFFGASAGAYLEWDESADQLRIMGASADATTSTGKLLLATSLTDINANDVIGKIDFQAPHEAGGTDAITVAASIQAIAQGTFSASVNATDLVFYTGHSEAAAEKIRFTSQNEIGIAGANYGTDGQVLTSGGAGAAVAWEDAGGGATINNATENELVTVASTTTQLDAEANLTWNGTQMSVGTTSADAGYLMHLECNAASGPAIPIRCEFVSDGTDGPRFFFKHTTATNAAGDNDQVAAWNFRYNNYDGTEREALRLFITVEDVTDGTEDSKVGFTVQNNGSDATAEITSLGAFANASDARFKTYEGTAHSIYGGTNGLVITDKLKTLNVGRYHTKDISAEKLAKAERHISPTAQDFYNTFGTGTELSGLGGEVTLKDGKTQVRHATLSAMDVAGVGIMAIKELIARIETLETEVAALKE